MADNHEEQEGPIHQSPWVFFLTVAVCYGVLMLIMFAKFFASDSMGLADVGQVFVLQAALFGGFAALFGGLVYGLNSFIGATSGDEH
ncbi:MAG: hypothetical protein ACQEVA_09925 [Myxococcota bacterium]